MQKIYVCALIVLMHCCTLIFLTRAYFQRVNADMLQTV